jgi:hypothetical protein
MENPGKNDLKDLYEEWVDEDMGHIKLIHTENKVFQRIRENNQDDWEAVELCREFLFDNAHLITFLKGRIEDVRGRCKEIGRV